MQGIHLSFVLLSSQSSGSNDLMRPAISALFSKKSIREIAFIPAQSDKARVYFDMVKEYYRSVGIEASLYFDIDEEYDPRKQAALFQMPAIHLSGGSTYHFLENLQRRSLRSLLREYVLKGGIIIGVSAGAIIMTPRIDSSKLCGDPIIPGLDTTALSLCKFEFVPHFNGSAEEKRIIAEYSRTVRSEVYACSEGSGIIFGSIGQEIIGMVEVCRNGDWIKVGHAAA
ncbi:MAG: Type 1 glutamine amidotransferase-like domain-containing protein [Fibrobacteria bacterium]